MNEDWHLISVVRNLVQCSIRLRRAKLNNDHEYVNKFEDMGRIAAYDFSNFIRGCVEFVKDHELDISNSPSPCLFCNNFSIDESENPNCEELGSIDDSTMTSTSEIGCVYFTPNSENINEGIKNLKEKTKEFWGKTDASDIQLIIMQFMKDEFRNSKNS